MSLSSAAAVAEDTLYYLESDGVVAFEAEAAELQGDWVLDTTLPDFRGDGYIRWNGDNFYRKADAGQGILTYNISIENEGNYQLFWRSRIAVGDDPKEHNDSWARMPSGVDVPEEEPLNGWTKAYMNEVDTWSWSTKTTDSVGNPLRQYFSKGDHRIEISGRSFGHAIDRVVLIQYENQPTGNARLSAVPVSETTTEPSTTGNSGDDVGTTDSDDTGGGGETGAATTGETDAGSGDDTGNDTGDDTDADGGAEGGTTSPDGGEADGVSDGGAADSTAGAGTAGAGTAGDGAGEDGGGQDGMTVTDGSGGTETVGESDTGATAGNDDGGSDTGNSDGQSSGQSGGQSGGQSSGETSDAGDGASGGDSAGDSEAGTAPDAVNAAIVDTESEAFEIEPGQCVGNRLQLVPTDDIDELDSGFTNTPQLGVDGNERALLRFDLQHVPALTSASLHYTVIRSDVSGRLSFQLGSHANWTEAGNAVETVDASGTPIFIAPDPVAILGSARADWAVNSRYESALDARLLQPEPVTILLDMVSSGASLSILSRGRAPNGPRLVLEGEGDFCNEYVLRKGAAGQGTASGRDTAASGASTSNGGGTVSFFWWGLLPVVACIRRLRPGRATRRARSGRQRTRTGEADAGLSGCAGPLSALPLVYCNSGYSSRARTPG